jgi:hypothetical protein
MMDRFGICFNFAFKFKLRRYSTENFTTPSERERACEVLSKTLGSIEGAKRLVVGRGLHSPTCQLNLSRV